MLKQAGAEVFAQTEEMLRGGNEPQAESSAAVAVELAVAQELRRTAGEGMPDPAFVAGLRAELLARADAAAQPARLSVHYATLNTALGQIGVAYRHGKLRDSGIRDGNDRDSKVIYCAAIDASPPGPLSSRAGEGEPTTAFERAVAQQFGNWPLRDSAPPPQLERAIRAALAGNGRFTAVDLSSLTPFQQRVLEKTAEIPRGEVRPYGWIAREIGAPGAVRAVGTALGHNPIPFLIPCHRVVRSDGSLGEYSGGGPAIKRQVLDLEGAAVADLERAARSGERYRGSGTTRIVCYPSCHAARRIRPENVVPFASLASARAAGFRPCALCRPA